MSFFRLETNALMPFEQGTSMTDWTKEEDEAFNSVEQQSNLGKQILKAQGQPYHFDTYVSPSQRNQVLEEVAKEFDKMKSFGDTAQSFASFVRDMKHEQ
jgi:hypothetical protein